MIDFVTFLQRRLFRPLPLADVWVDQAFADTVGDSRYRQPDATAAAVEHSIEHGRGELPVFLFRLGQAIRSGGGEPGALDQMHWLMRELCSCEIYFNNVIGPGLVVVHGEGTVIGSRNVIGKGFTIHHGCTIGHRANGEGRGSRIGDDVTLYANSSIIGERSVGDRCVIGAGLTIIDDVPDDGVVTLRRSIP